MKVIILAAGRGSRMKSSTEVLPKGMVSVFKKPILQHCIETLEKSGIQRKDIAIVTGYNQEKITFENVTYFHNEIWADTNMFYSLTQGSEWLSKEPCIMCYSDILFSTEPILKLMESKADLAMTSYSGFWDLWESRFENPLEDLETFILNEGVLTEIGAKPQSKEQVMGQYMGLLKITPKSWTDIQNVVKKPMKKTVEKLDMTTLLHQLLYYGHDISVLNCHDLWLECDNEADVELYEKKYKDTFTKQ